MSRVNIMASFRKYTPVDNQPHYVFLSDNSKYLVNCQDYPKLLSFLSPNDFLSIEADISEQSSEGIKLINVKFGEINE